MWQEVRENLRQRAQGRLEVVTVAMDVGGMATVAPWVERAAPRHPSLVDTEHSLGRLFGVVNVPSGIWIDEQGLVVRPPEPAFPGQVTFESEGFDGLSPEEAETRMALTMRVRVSPRRYLAALQDWAERGEASPHRLGPEEVVRRSAPTSRESSLAAAEFEIAQHLVSEGHDADAVRHFREAHRLQPGNWTYKRQAWSLADVHQRPTAQYDSDWTSEITRVGPENYYPRLEL